MESRAKELDILIILDVVDYYHNGQNGCYYVVEHRDSLYRKYEGYWTQIIDGKSAGYGSVPNTYQSHLNNLWDKQFKDKRIEKKTIILIE